MVVHLEVEGAGDDVQLLHLGGSVLVHQFGTRTGEGLFAGDDEVGLAEVADDLFHAVDFADNLPLAVLLLCKGEHVVE